MSKPVVKFLSPYTGKYEFATVIEIGDLEKLNTSIKTDIVSAINSLIEGGVGNSNGLPLSPEDAERIKNIQQSIEDLKNGTFQIEDWGSVNNYYKDQLTDAIKKLQADNRESFQLKEQEIQEQVDQSLATYKQQLNDYQLLLNSANTDVKSLQEEMEEKARLLNFR